MRQHLARISVIAIFLMLLGCSNGSGSPTAPPVDDASPDVNLTEDPGTNLTPTLDPSQNQERILGNFYYISEDEETLAWGTVLDSGQGWEYRLDYVGPYLRALERSDVTRSGQATFDLTWLNLIDVGVSYTNKPLPIPPDLAQYEQGEWMDYRVDINNNTQFDLDKQIIVATQVDMFNIPLGTDARDIWTNVSIPIVGQSLFGDWTVEPWLPDGIYYTRVRVGFQLLGGWVTIVIFDSKAGAYEVAASGPEYFDPVARAVTTTPVVSVGENVHYQDNGSFDPDGGSIVLYEWDFDNDGIFDTTGPMADTSFLSPGVYYCNLRVTDDEGATDDLTDDAGDELIEVTVTPPPVPPIAIAQASAYNAYVDDPITFDGTDSYDPDGGAIVLYEWDWDNDGTYDELGPVLNHSWDTPGVYLVQLRVTDDEVQTDTLDIPLEITITEAPKAPTACFTWLPEIPIPCEDVEFNGSCSTDPDGTIVLYEWDFDGDTTVDFSDSAPLAIHAFDTPGDYQVTLRVTDDDGMTDLYVDTVTVENAVPTAVIDVTLPSPGPYPGDDIEFDGTDSHDNDCGGLEIIKYEWDFDNDGTWDDVGEIVQHAYPSAGTYHVQLRVTDDEGDTDILDVPYEIVVDVELMDPVAVGGADPTSQTICEPIHFYDDGSYDPDGGAITLFEWDWDNDGVYDETGDDVYHTFNSIGIYPVQLRVTDDEGATDTLDVPIEITMENALPTAVATADKFNAHVGEGILFDGTESYDNDCDGAIVLWEWDFDGDGVYDDTGDIADHTYSAPGTYMVQLRVTDDEGDTDTLDTPLEINIDEEKFDPEAFAAYDPDPQIVCEEVHLFDDGSYDPDGGVITLYEWDIDNDGVYDLTGADAYYTWDTVGVYPVQLRVTDDEGATDTLDIPLEVNIVNALPTSDATADKYEAVVDEIITFDGSTSHDNDCEGEIVLWEWDFEDDGTYIDAGMITTHSYSVTGTYYVDLRVTDDEGGTDTLDTLLEIQISNELFDPVAVAEAYPNPQDLCGGIYLQGSGSYDPDGGDIQLWEWDLDNDGTYDDSGESVFIIFPEPGTKYVQLRVTDDEGATDTLDIPLEVVVNDNPPVADAVADKYNAQVGELITLDGSGSSDPNEPCGDLIVWYEWDIDNDGTYDLLGETVDYSYDTPGTYYVQLRVTDNFGMTDTLDTPLEINVTVENFDPVAFAMADPNPQIVCEEVHLYDDGSYDPDGGSITLYEWDIDNDGVYDFSGPDLFYTWNDVGTYYVQFRVTDDEGSTDELDTPLEIIIENALPTSEAMADKYSAQVDEDINFDGTASHDNDCEGEITLWEWDWEDDGVYTDFGSLQTHSYSVAGTYYVDLRVTDDEGGTDTLDTLLEIQINEALFDPVAVATAIPNPAPLCDSVAFDGSGSYDPDGGLITLYEWDWDYDGTYDDTGVYQEHTFGTPGTYNVQLRVTDDEGATDTLDVPLSIQVDNEPPVAQATADDYDVYTGEIITFDGSTSFDPNDPCDAIVLYEWDFDYDGVYDDSGLSVQFAYATAGIYNVQLRVTDSYGLTDTLDIPLEITVTNEKFDPVAIGDAVPKTASLCQDVEFFDDGSYDPDGGAITLFEWDWDNDGVYDETGNAVFHSWTSPGIYTVQMRVTDDEGATDTLDIPIEITVENAAPVAGAVADDYDVFTGTPVGFDASSSYDPDESCGDSIVLYEWDWENDGTYDVTGVTQSHTYTTPGIYQVQCRVTDSYGEIDTLDVPLEIQVSDEKFDPVAIGDATPKTIGLCQPAEFFDNGSYDPDGGPITLIEWDWDNDGVYDETGNAVFHSWTAPGVYTVQMRVTDDEGATDTLDIPIEITVENADPIADADADDYNVFTGTPIGFDASASSDPDASCGDSIVLYEWDWENDGTYDDTGVTQSHTYTAEGTYYVQLRVTDSFGATDTLDIPLEINVADEKFDPVAFADADPLTANLCQQVHLYDNGSYDPDGGSITDYEWDLDNDGVYDEVGTDVYTSWDTPGTYYVQLRVTDDEGATDTLDTPLQIDVVNQDPTAVASADDYDVYTGVSINLDASASSDPDETCGDSITLYEWDWTNDGTFDDTGVTQSHSYATPGTYYIQLRVTDSFGGTDLLDTPLEITVTVETLDPIADVDADVNPQTICEDINLDASSSNDPDGGSIVTYEWDLDNDGLYDDDTGPTTSVTSNTPGSIFVDVKVTDDEGETDTLDVPLELVFQNALPTAVATADDATPVICEPVEFDGTASYDNDCTGSIVLWEWDFDNDGTYDETGSIVSHTWNTVGTYYVQLRVTDDEGATDTLDAPIEINPENALPTAVATADDYDVYTGVSVNFDGTASYDNDCSGSIVLYEWDWENDGTYDATGSIQSHSYGSAGTYYVQLRVTDDEGATDTLDTPLEILVSVEFFPPVAYADVDNPVKNVCEEFNFFDDGSYDPDGGLITLYEWDFENDGTWDDTGDSVLYAYDTPGTYYVQLRVTDDEGATDTLDAPIEVTVNNALPTADASVDKLVGTTSDTFNFDGSTSTDNDCGGTEITLYEWDYDWDGSTFDVDDTGETVGHQYLTPGAYDIMLRVTDDEGETDMLDEPLSITVTMGTDCESGIHYFDSLDPASERGVATGFSTLAYSVLPRADVAYIESGAFAGQGLVQGGPNSIVTFDPDFDANDPIDDGISVYPTGGIAGDVVVTNLDSAPYGGIVAVTTSDNPSEIRLLDTTVLFGNFFPYEMDFGANYQISAIDFREDGDIYMIMRDGTNTFLYYSDYLGDPTYYNMWTPVNITALVGPEADIFDIAYNWDNDKLYIFDAGEAGRGRVTILDAATFTLDDQFDDLFAAPIDFVSNPFIGLAGFADIEIDHMGDPDDELCHILLYARFSESDALLRKYSDTMVMVDESPYVGPVWTAFTINPEPVIADRNLMLPGESDMAFWTAAGYQ